MTTAWMDQKIDAYKNGVGALAEHTPAIAESYNRFTGDCFEEGRLPAKTKQLIALGISLFANNEVCTLYHVHEAKSNGASEEEIWEAVGVAAAIGGGHAMSQGVTRVRGALQG